MLGTILNFLYRTKGKQLRPIFVFLSAKLHGGTNESSKLAACSVELLHTATLVHDDVVDESYERRGSFSVKALWKNKLAVLVGDYILARGLLLQLESKKIQLPSFDFARCSGHGRGRNPSDEKEPQAGY